jgi:hypothetical protein
MVLTARVVWNVGQYIILPCSNTKHKMIYQAQVCNTDVGMSRLNDWAVTASAQQRYQVFSRLRHQVQVASQYAIYNPRPVIEREVGVRRR